MFVPLLSLAASAAEPTWESTIDRVVPAVVALKVTGTRDFDTEDARNSQGTGFVIDAERGIILTNRHMVHAGPVVAEAVFENHEEVELEAIYRDPVHDFGFYRFDPSEVKHMEVTALPLAPDAARVGLDIRVVGNDSGEKVSILDGTLARLDRNAPNYGTNTYNDFNTFYIQAASNTSGGSSGSPVVDIDGNVVALNAGGKTQAASSFYLPLDRVVRAYDLLVASKPVPRGTLQATLRYQAFDELERLGLTDATQTRVRAADPDGTGMLVVDTLVPDGPADGKLEPGDVIVEVGGELISRFVPLEAVLDNNVGKTVKATVERGGEAIELDLDVQDLHAISPSQYLEVGRAILNDLSYMQARNHKIPVQGVYVAVAGYMLTQAQIPEGAILTHIDGEATPDLATMKTVLESKGHGQRIRLRFFHVADPRHAHETVATMDRQWFPLQVCTRDDSNGLWPCEESPPPPKLTRVPPSGAGLLLPEGKKPSRELAASLVLVDFDIPYPTAGVKDLNYVGVGTVIDTERGLVLVDRDTVPVRLGDMMLTFAASIRVPGTVVYLHPVHNFAVVQYDPALLGDVPVQAVEWAKDDLEEDDWLWQVGLTRAFELVQLQTWATAVEGLDIGISATPRYRDRNVEGVITNDAVPSLGGVLTDKKGRVQALWASFLDQQSGERTFYGLPKRYLMPALQPILDGEEPVWRSLGVEFTTISLADARDRGVPDPRVEQLLTHDREGRRALEIIRITGGSPAHELLQHADILVAIDGEPVTRMHAIDALYDKETVAVTVVRDGREITVDVPTVPLSGMGVDRVVSFAGLLLHEPHHEVAQQKGIEPSGVYIAWLWYGSPAARYGLRPTRRILEIEGQTVSDLDALLEVVSGMQDRQAVRVKMQSLDGSEQVRTLKLDYAYWPTELLELQDGKWVRSRADAVSEPNE